MEIIAVVIIVITIVLVLIFKKNSAKRTAQEKREHIEQIYTTKLNNILQSGKSYDEIKKDKLDYIKICNSELSRNIFFTKEQADKLIEKLTRL